MYTIKSRIVNVMSANTVPFAYPRPPLSLTTVRFTEQDFQTFVNQVEKSKPRATSDDSQTAIAKNGQVDLIDIASWIRGRAPMPDLQPVNLFTGQPVPTSNSYVDPCTIPFVNFTQLSEPSTPHYYGSFTTTDKPLTSSLENPDGLNSASRHATPSTSVMVTDEAVPDDHYDVTTTLATHSLVTSTNNPSPTAPQTTCDLADLASTPPNSVIHNNYGNHPIEQVEKEIEDVIGEILDETPHFVVRVIQKPNQQPVDSNVISDEYDLPTKEISTVPSDGKAANVVSDKSKDSGDMVQSISEDKEKDVIDNVMRVDVDELPEPVDSVERVDDNVIPETVLIDISSDDTEPQEPEKPTIRAEQDKTDKVAGTSILVDNENRQEASDPRLMTDRSELLVISKEPTDTPMSNDTGKAAESISNEKHNSQQQMGSEEHIPESKRHDPATGNHTNIEQLAFESMQPAENASLVQQSSLEDGPSTLIDIEESDDDSLTGDEDSSTGKRLSTEYTHGTEIAIKSTTESTKWVYRSTDIEVLEPAALNERKRKSLEKVSWLYTHTIIIST